MMRRLGFNLLAAILPLRLLFGTEWGRTVIARSSYGILARRIG